MKKKIPRHTELAAWNAGIVAPGIIRRGNSKCPGSTGPGNSAENTSSCGFADLLRPRHEVMKPALNAGEYPCKRFDKETGEFDSLITHRESAFQALPPSERADSRHSC